MLTIFNWLQVELHICRKAPGSNIEKFSQTEYVYNLLGDPICRINWISYYLIKIVSVENNSKQSW